MERKLNEIKEFRVNWIDIEGRMRFCTIYYNIQQGDNYDLLAAYIIHFFVLEAYAAIGNGKDFATG